MTKLFIFILLLLLAMPAVADAQSRRVPQETSNEKKVRPTPTPVAARAEKIPEDTRDFSAAEVDEEALKIDTDLVSIPVSVLDRRGMWVSDMKCEEFQIFEDGKPQEITFFATTEQPFTVVLMLDVSLSSKFKIEEIQNAAIAFVSQLAPKDRVKVISFSEQILSLSEFTSDRRELVSAIRRARFSDGTSVYEAFDHVVNYELKGIKGRKAIVMFSDGVDTTSRESYLQENLRDADELDALVFPIEYDTYDDVNLIERGGQQVKLPGPVPITVSGGGRRDDDPNRILSKGTTRAEYDVAAAYLRGLADRTGGKVYRASTTSDMGSAFAKIAQELRQQYSIGYSPPNPDKKGTVRKIKIRVTRPNLVVKARESYTIGEPTKKRKKSR